MNGHIEFLGFFMQFSALMQWQFRVKTMIGTRFMKLLIYIYFEIESLKHTKVK